MFFWVLLFFIFIFVIAAIYWFRSKKEKKYPSTKDHILHTAADIASEFEASIWAGMPIDQLVATYPEFNSDSKLSHKVSSAVISALIAYEIINKTWRTDLLGVYKNKIGCEGKYIIEQAIGNIVDNIYNCEKLDSCFTENEKKINSLFTFMREMEVTLCSPHLTNKIIATINKHKDAAGLLNNISSIYSVEQ